MRIAHYKPIRNALIQLLQGMLKLPAFVSRLRRLHRAGCYPSPLQRAAWLNRESRT
jgi:hypothetical protein